MEIEAEDVVERMRELHIAESVLTQFYASPQFAKNGYSFDRTQRKVVKHFQ